MTVCKQCEKEFDEHEGQACAGCEEIFCPDCFGQFDTCELCGRSFCSECAKIYIPIPGAKSVCNDCYGDYVEDTDYLYD